MVILSTKYLIHIIEEEIFFNWFLEFDRENLVGSYGRENEQFLQMFKVFLKQKFKVEADVHVSKKRS